jgi:hypothetical protein
LFSDLNALAAFRARLPRRGHKGSAESKDSDEEIQAALERIEERLDRLEPSGNGERDGSAAAQPL